MRKKELMIIGAALSLVFAVGCGEDRDDALGASTVAPVTEPVTGTDTVETYPANGATSAVLAIDNNFIPQTLSVAAGTEVVFTNNGRNAHNVVPADDPTATAWGVLDADFQPTDTYSHVFTTPGTYIYYCTIHGTAKAGMFGTIEVTAP